MHYLTDILRDYFKLSGRLSRKGYWIYVLWLLGFSAAAGLLEGVFQIPHLHGFPTGWLVASVLAFFCIPNWTATVRRLHDIGWRGWWVLLCLIPLVGPIAIAVICLFPSSPAGDRFDTPRSDAGQADVKYAVLHNGKIEET